MEDALAILAGTQNVKPIAGGTDLLVELDRGAHDDLEVLLDLSRIPGSSDLTGTESEIRLGPLVTHNQVAASEMCRSKVLPLAQACLEVGSPQLRNRATVVGNVVTASPANDTISALVALGASVEISSVDGARTMPITAFITGFRQTDLRKGELVSGLIVPTLSETQRGVFVKLGLRRAQAISVVHLAITVDLSEGVVSGATAALGSVAPTVVLVPELAETLRGRPLDEAAIADASRVAVAAAQPIDDLRASAQYRLDTVGVMVTRALRVLAADAQEAAWPESLPLLWGGGFEGSFPAGPDRALEVGPGDVISAVVNGEVISAPGSSGVTLLDWLREDVGVTGVKEGCAEGECGACTVDLDGAAVMSCLVPAPRASGSEIITAEGLADGDQMHPIQEAFVETGAVQCGFCTPGLVVACAKLLEESPSPDVAHVRRGLAGNLCRCTGYRSIEAAVALVAIRSEQ